MTPEAWRTLSATLDRLLDLPGPHRRLAIETLRATDPDLCREVESLLAEQDSQDRFQAPPSQLLDEIPATVDELHFDNGKAGRYVIQEEIARGGMGAIFRALDPDIGRMLAVKALLPRTRAHPDLEYWFDSEARITGRLQHPGIPPVHEMGRLADGSPFFVMKLIEGRTLTSAIRDPNWPARCIGVFEQISSTLAYAHSKGIIHRDLKPSNVMVGAFGEVQVMDWGLARSIHALPDGEASAGDSDFGGVAGTPAYMAPEQARGDRDLDERCDVFGLGALLCAMMTGHPPYAGTTQQEALQAAIRADTAGALKSMSAAGADADLLAIAARCLAGPREDRYRHAGEVAAAVTAYRASVAERLRQTELAREKAVVKAAEERRRRRVTMALAAVLAVLAVGVVGVWAWQDRLQNQKASRAADLNRQIASALDDADSERQSMVAALRDQQSANTLLSNMQPWQARLQRAVAVAEQARKLADSDTELLTPANSGRLTALEAKLIADRADYAFAERVDRLRLELFDPTILRKPGIVNSSYEKLFESHGLLVTQRQPHPERDPATRLSGSPLRYIAVAALDDWANAVTFGNPRDDAVLSRLLDLARKLDPDPWRDRFRQPAVWTDPTEVTRLTEELNLHEQSPQILRVASELRRQHRLDAAALLNRSLQVYPADFWLLYQYGIVTMVSDSAASHSAFRAALALRPKNAYVLNNFGITSAMRRDYKIAEDSFRQAISLQPGFVDAVCNLGKCRNEQGDYALAIADYRRAQQLDVTLAEPFNGLGVAYCCLGEFDEALTAFVEAVKLDPQSADFQMKRKMVSDALALRSTIEAAENGTNAAWESLERSIAGNLTASHPFDCFRTLTEHRRAGYRVELKAGTAYQFDLSADFDPLLRIEDDRFRPLLLNNDQRPGVRNSRLIFTPSVTGHYRLVVTSSVPGKTGLFTLRGRKTASVGEPMRRQGTLTRQDTALQNRYLHKHAVSLTAGQPVVIRLESRAFDTKLWLMDGAGKTYLVSAERMHPFNGHWSRLDFTPESTNTFLVIVTTAAMDRIGEYSLTIEQFGNLDATTNAGTYQRSSAPQVQRF